MHNSQPKIGRNDPCPCGSGQKYKKCHGDLRKGNDPLFAEKNQPPSLLERNLILLSAVTDIFGKMKWEDLKRKISGEHVRALYEVIAYLWPPDTDLISLLPNDNKLRGLYLGEIEPQLIAQHVFRFGLYADELMIVDPFHNPHFIRGEFNPLENPDQFRADTLKLVAFIFTLAPWIAAGLVKLIPDPGYFDLPLRKQFIEMARDRVGEQVPDEMLKEFGEFQRADLLRVINTLPTEHLRSKIKKIHPDITDAELVEALAYMAKTQREDPLALEQSIIDSGDQLHIGRTGANLETALYLSHLTGAFPYTSFKWKWNELLSVASDLPPAAKTWTPLTNAFQGLKFKFLNNVDSNFACEMHREGRLESFRHYLKEIWNKAYAQSDPTKIEVSAREFKDQLTDEYRKAQADWDKIDRDLATWVGMTSAAALSASSLASAILSGGLTLALPALGFCISAVTKLATSHIERREFRKKIPMSVFIDLSQYKSTT
jgi:hypothetical protein